LCNLLIRMFGVLFNGINKLDLIAYNVIERDQKLCELGNFYRDTLLDQSIEKFI